MKLIMENWRSFLTEDNVGSPSPVDLDFLDLLDKEEINEIRENREKIKQEREGLLP